MQSCSGTEVCTQPILLPLPPVPTLSTGTRVRTHTPSLRSDPPPPSPSHTLCDPPVILGSEVLGRLGGLVEEASPLLFQMASFSSPSTRANTSRHCSGSHSQPPPSSLTRSRARVVSCGSTMGRAHGLCRGGRLHCAPQFGGGPPALGTATRPPGVGWTVCAHAQRD